MFRELRVGVNDDTIIKSVERVAAVDSVAEAIVAEQTLQGFWQCARNLTWDRDQLQVGGAQVADQMAYEQAHPFLVICRVRTAAVPQPSFPKECAARFHGDLNRINCLIERSRPSVTERDDVCGAVLDRELIKRDQQIALE